MLNSNLMNRVDSVVEHSEVFRTLESRWEDLVSETTFRNRSRFPEGFMFASAQHDRENFAAFEDDGSVHSHVPNLHVGVGFGQETRSCVADERTVANLARSFAEANAVELQALADLVAENVAMLAPRNEQVVAASNAVNEAREALHRAEDNLEACLN